jgi:hypothetical protein
VYTRTNTGTGACVTEPSCNGPSYTQRLACAARWGTPVASLDAWSETVYDAAALPNSTTCSNSPPAPSSAPIGFCGTTGGPITLVANHRCAQSPIVIDAFGEGFHLTSLASGVQFRALPDDDATQISWTDKHWHNGWLLWIATEMEKLIT